MLEVKYVGGNAVVKNIFVYAFLISIIICHDVANKQLPFYSGKE